MGVWEQCVTTICSVCAATRRKARWRRACQRAVYAAVRWQLILHQLAADKVDALGGGDVVAHDEQAATVAGSAGG